MITLQELLAIVSWNDVVVALRGHRVRSKRIVDCRRLFVQLSLPATQNRSVGMLTVDPPIGNSRYHLVFHLRDGNNRYVRKQSICNLRWDDCLRLVVAPENFIRYLPAEVVCHTLLELTYRGFDSDFAMQRLDTSYFLNEKWCAMSDKEYENDMENFGKWLSNINPSDPAS